MKIKLNGRFAPSPAPNHNNNSAPSPGGAPRQSSSASTALPPLVPPTPPTLTHAQSHQSLYPHQQQVPQQAALPSFTRISKNQPSKHQLQAQAQAAEAEEEVEAEEGEIDEVAQHGEAHADGTARGGGRGKAAKRSRQSGDSSGSGMDDDEYVNAPLQLPDSSGDEFEPGTYHRELDFYLVPRDVVSHTGRQWGCLSVTLGLGSSMQVSPRKSANSTLSPALFLPTPSASFVHDI